MKIIKETANIMILKNRNILGFIIGFIFVLVGIIAFVKPDFFTNKPPLWFGLIFILFGGLAIFGAKVITITLDKTTNKLSFLRKGLLGQSIKEYNLDQIKEVELSISFPSAEKMRQGFGYLYRLSFVLNTGEIIPLNPGSRSNKRTMSTERIIGARIASFLNVPFQERRPPTVSELLSTVQSTIQKEIEEQKTDQNKTENKIK